jgi:hypothetical protein
MSIHSTVDRRAFLRATGAGAAGVASAAALGSRFFSATLAAQNKDNNGQNNKQAGNPKLTKEDIQILVAAEIAEALAVTTYTGIIQDSPFFTRLADDDQGYLQLARQEEMSHYLLEAGASGQPSPFFTFYYPPKMFTDAQTTLNTLVTLEDAFIAAYLVGVRQFSTPDLRVTSARIMGIESDHRTLARVIGPGVALIDGGPIENITGIQGQAESVDPPNNNGYERTLGWTEIDQAVTALLPFVDQAAAMAAGFDISRPFVFSPFQPTLAIDLGEFHSFLG